MASGKKRSNYSWDRSGIRKITFKALKKGEKIGFSLGGDGKRREIISVKEGTQSYWKGVKIGYTIVSVNGTKVDDITVKTAIKSACQSGKDFTIGMSTALPTDAFKMKNQSKPERSSSRAKKKERAQPKIAKKRVANVDDSKEEVVVQGYNDSKPIIDQGTFSYQDEVDIGEWFTADDQDDDYMPIARRE
jgi:C-terminal processing protease CtpA/Prc